MNKDTQCQLGDHTQQEKQEIILALNLKERDTLIAALLAAPDNREICPDTVASLLTVLLKDESRCSPNSSLSNASA